MAGGKKKRPGEGGPQRPQIDTAALLSRVDIVQVINARVPLAKSGAEYEACCPFHSEDTPSFKVSPAKQFYHCFGCGAHGDAIGFLQEYEGLSFVDACRALGADVPGSDTREAAPGSRSEASPVEPSASADSAGGAEAAGEKDRTPWEPVLPVPEGAPEAPLAHEFRGRWSRRWAYLDAAGRLLGYTCRFEKSSGGKEILPLTWCRHPETGATAWKWVAFPEPRPLYGLDRLAAKPEAFVLVVEGEKCADAAQAELPELVVVSCPGGGKAVRKAGWSPLAGRKAGGWADCDAKRVPLTPAEKKAGVDPASKPLLPEEKQPGVMAMAQIAEQVLALGGRWWDVKIPAPGAVADGWDIADAIEEGLRGAELAEHIRVSLVERPPAPAETTPPAIEAGASRVELVADHDGWRRLLLRKDDKLVDCRENVYLVLKHHPAWSGVLNANVFARQIAKLRPAPWQDPRFFFLGEEWSEDDPLRIGLWLAQQERLLVRSVENIALAVGWTARESPWHPVREYLDALEWDGVERSRDWLTDFLGVRRSPYSQCAGPMILIGMVARVYEPGCMLRSMPILEGPQFKGKSTALRILADPWFGNTPLDLNSKDVYMVIQGCLLYEIAELDAFNRAEVTRIKAFISSEKDRFRAPYDRDVKDHLRQTSFGGTTNQDEYLKDATGNTRYWPLLTQQEKDIDLDGLAAMKDQLLAEAVALYRRGERWHPTAEEQRLLFEPEQAARELLDPWVSMIGNWLRQSTRSRVTTTDVLFELLKVEPSKIDAQKSMTTRIGTAMKKHGWHKRRETEGAREYYYERPEGWGEAPQSPDAGIDHVPF